MALFVELENGMQATFYVQDDVISAKNVKSIFADGHELDAIQSCVTGIPMIKNSRFNRWWGDDAKFVVGNWPSIVKMWRNK